MSSRSTRSFADEIMASRIVYLSSWVSHSYCVDGEMLKPDRTSAAPATTTAASTDARIHFDAAAHGAGIADAPSDGQRLGRRARPHDDARGGSRGRGRVLGASRTRSPSRSHPHPYVSIKNILLRLIGQLGAF